MIIWKDVVGFEGIYKVSSNGDVVNINFKKTGKERIMNGSFDKDGYRYVELSKDRIRRKYKVHRIVAIAFIENINNYPVVNHKDEDKQNNCVNNLEWCDVLYNNNYGNRKNKIYKPILQYDSDMNLIKRWGSSSEASKILNIFATKITSCAKGKVKTYYGFHWKYEKKYL